MTASKPAKAASRRRRPSVVVDATRPTATPSSDPAKRYVDGVEVVDDEALPSNLPNGRSLRIRVLTLADGTKRYGCPDCPGVAMPTRGAMQKHRWSEHGRPLETADSSPQTAVSTSAPAPSVAKAVAGRPKGSISLSPSVAAMTLAEVFQLARDSVGTALLLERADAESRTWKDRAITAEGRLRKLQTALDKAGFKLQVEE